MTNLGGALRNGVVRRASLQLHSGTSMLKVFKEIYQYRELIFYLVTTDLKTRYRGSALGFLWTLLNPLLLMLVLWGVFSKLGRFDERNYALFLLSGIMVWNFFSQSLDGGLNSIIKQRSLLQKIYVPKVVFPLAVVTSNLVNFVFFLAAYLIIALFTPVGWSPTLPLLLPALAMLFLLSLGGALLMATVNVFFRDFSHLTAALLRMLFYLTPIIYPPHFLGERAQVLLQLNPVFYPVTTVRALLYYGKVPSLEMWLVGFGVALAMFCFGLTVFLKNELKFIYYA